MSVIFGRTQDAYSVPFDKTVPPFYSEHTQGVIEELRSQVTLKKSEIVTSLNGTTTLTLDSDTLQIVTGTSTGYSFKLPDATTLFNGRKFEIINISTISINVKDGASTVLSGVPANSIAYITLEDNLSVAGNWIFFVPAMSDINTNNPNFVGVKDAFEDFMFDAYAGNGGNDNQYSFTAVANLGTSDIDGAVAAVGNDYEGIHILNTLAIATSRPLVHSFNGVNRIKLGYHSESYEIRVRIDSVISTVANAYTARFGLMDTITVGSPANGVLFSYNPVNQITAVAQVLTVTPNTFPVATFQNISFNPTRANNTLYTITINGTLCSYTSDANATDAEIAAGLVAAVNGSAQSGVVTASGVSNVDVVSDILGTAFTYSNSATVVATVTTANVPIEGYTQTINGTPFTYVSDGTPTATEVCNGLRTLINAGGLPVTTSGTTTLIITANVAGTAFTYSGTSDLTQTLTVANVAFVAYSGNWIFSVIKTSSVTSLDTGINAVPGSFYKLKCVIAANGTEAFVYIDDVYIGKITAAQPTVGLRYTFKLEKTVGVSPRIVSIDYITWRRNR